MIESPHTWPLALGAAALAGATWIYGEVTHTRDRVDVIESARTHETETLHVHDVDLTRELTELRAENATTARIVVDVLNEVRELRGKPATSFHAATESARQRAEQERGE